MRAAIYLRISKDRTGAEAGVKRQRHDCRALIESKGWEVVGEFMDNDTSAYSGKRRPKFEALLDLVRARAVDVVVAWHPDRIVRNPRELEDVIDALDHARCKVETVRAGTLDLSTRSGRTTARLVGAVARDESEAKSERLRAMHEAKVRAGEWKGGPRPYGYRQGGDAGLLVDETEATIIRWAAERVLAGENLHALCMDLNRRGVATVKGGLWKPPSLRNILIGPTAVGRRHHQGDDVPAGWEPILDDATRRRLTRALRTSGRGPVARVAVLAGVARCGLCGTALVSGRKDGGKRMMACPSPAMGGCGKIVTLAEPLEQLVIGWTFARVESPGVIADLAGDEAAAEQDIAAELAAIEDELEILAAAAKELGAAAMLAARAPYVARRDELTARMAVTTTSTALRPYIGRKGALAEAWPAKSLDQRRAIIKAAMAEVVVNPTSRRGPGFDTGRVSPPAWLI